MHSRKIISPDSFLNINDQSFIKKSVVSFGPVITKDTQGSPCYGIEIRLNSGQTIQTLHATSNIRDEHLSMLESLFSVISIHDTYHGKIFSKEQITNQRKSVKGMFDEDYHKHEQAGPMFFTDIDQIIEFSKHLPDSEMKNDLLRTLENTKKEGFRIVDLATRG